LWTSFSLVLTDHALSMKINMKQTTLRSILVLIYLISCTTSYAELLVGSHPLSVSVSQSDCIVEAELLNYTANGTLVPGDIQPAGNYDFKVISVLKGAANPIIHVALPQLLLHYYDFSALPTKPGGKFLLLMRKNDGAFSPVDRTLPLIPLANNILAKSDAQDVQQKVIYLMLASSVDASIRKVDVYLLRDVVDPQITLTLVAYLNDSDLGTRDAVLYCLATNQQVAAIPRIAELEATLDRQGQGAESVEALGNFATSEAIPYLRPLIFTSEYLVRQEVAGALYKIGDTSCIPYFMLALRDPDPEQVIPAEADLTLHRLIPKLGPAPLQSHDDYVKHRQENTKLIYDWWADELNGKHVKPDDKTVLNSPDSEASTYTLLFSPVASTRKEVASKLEKDANADAVPYLVLALQDPDNTVAYSAYKTLHRLVGILGPAATDEQFRSNSDLELKHIYSWWNAYLSPKPFQRPDTTGFIHEPSNN